MDNFQNCDSYKNDLEKPQTAWPLILANIKSDVVTFSYIKTLRQIDTKCQAHRSVNLTIQLPSVPRLRICEVLLNLYK
jgi:hypothetical protein